MEINKHFNFRFGCYSSSSNRPAAFDLLSRLEIFFFFLLPSYTPGTLGSNATDVFCVSVTSTDQKETERKKIKIKNTNETVSKRHLKKKSWSKQRKCLCVIQHSRRLSSENRVAIKAVPVYISRPLDVVASTRGVYALLLLLVYDYCRSFYSARQHDLQPTKIQEPRKKLNKTTGSKKCWT